MVIIKKSNLLWKDIFSDYDYLLIKTQLMMAMHSHGTYAGKDK